MKKLTGALVLSFSLLLVTGCHKAGEPSVREDASTPGPTGTTQGALTGDSGQPAAGQPNPGGQPATDTGTAPGAQKPDAAAEGTPGGATAMSEAERQAKEACIDKWLQGKKLDPYGNAEGTMYAGGSPLFNEQTGEMKDRLEFVYQKQPEARKACASAGTSAPTK